MAITWRLGTGYTSGVDYNTASGLAATSGTINKPTGLVSGQTLRAFFYSQSSTGAAATAPSGWTLETAPPSRRGGIYRKYIPDASLETATSYTWSTAASARWAAAIWISEGEDGTTPLDVATSWSTETTSPTVASTTASKANSLEAVFSYWNNSSTSITTVSQASTTKLIEAATPNTTTTSGIAIFSGNVAAIGGVSSRNLTGSPTPTNMAGVHIIYSPSTAPSPVTATGGVTFDGTATASDGGAVRTATGGLTFSGTASGSSALQYQPQPFSIPQMDDWIAKGYPVHWAHRGGSANWSEMTMYAYDRAVAHGARCLEVSVQRSSDGVWIMSHDPTLTRVTGNNITISSTNSSAMLGMAVTAPSGGGVIGRLEDILTAYPDRVLLVDNKPGSFFSDFLDLLETVPNNKTQIVVKLDGQFGTLANFQAAKARGFKTAGYWYPNNYAANLPSRAPYTDYIGMQYDASPSEWADIFACGKPVWGHVLQNSTQFNQAAAAGVDIFQDADVTGLMPRWNVAYTNAGTTTAGSAQAIESIIGADAVSRATSSVLEVWTGSSTTAGLNATTPQQRWNWLVADDARAAYPQTNSQTASFDGIADIQKWIAANGALPNGLHFLGAGVSGTSSASWLSTADTNALIALQPKRIFITIGSNDYQSGRPPATYQSNIEAKMATLRAGIPGVKFTLIHSYQRMDVTTPAYPWSDYRDALIAIAAANPSDTTFRNNDPTFVAVGIPGADPNGYMSADNVHLNNAGHAFLRTATSEALGIPAAATPLASPPDMVDGVKIGNASTQVLVSWLPVDGATGYTIKYRPGTSGAWSTTPGSNPAGTFITGLTNGQSYQVAVYATNANGDGLPSVPQDALPVVDPWTVTHSDSFNRADGALGTSDGAYGGDPDAWGGSNSGIAIVGNQVQIITPATITTGFTPLTANHGIRIKITSLPVGSQFFLNLRRAPVTFGTATSRYMCYVTTSGALVVQKQVAGSTTTLAGSGVAGTIVAGDTLEFRVNGTLLEVLINGIVTWSLTDTSVTGAGVVALSATSALTAVSFDDFRLIENAQVTTAAGGVTFGGSGQVAGTGTATATGGITLGGSAVAIEREVATASQAITFGGSGVGIARGISTASGSVTFGGSAGVSQIEARTGSAGVSFGGVGLIETAFMRTAGGSVTFGGGAGGFEAQVRSAGGNVTFGGFADASSTGGSQARTASGGITLGGSATVSGGTQTRTAAGTVTFAGIAFGVANGYPTMPTNRTVTGGARRTLTLGSNRVVE